MSELIRTYTEKRGPIWNEKVYVYQCSDCGMEIPLSRKHSVKVYCSKCRKVHEDNSHRKGKQ